MPKCPSCKRDIEKPVPTKIFGNETAETNMWSCPYCDVILGVTDVVFPKNC